MAGITTDRIKPAQAKEWYHLSYPQKRIWILSHFKNACQLCNNVFTLNIRGNLDYRSFDRAILSIIKKHESLRTVFKSIGEEIRQHVLDADTIQFHASVIDIPERKSEDIATNVIEGEFEYPFDLGGYPLLRCTLIRIGDAEHICVFNFHRIVCDDKSVKIFVSEFAKFYATPVSNGHVNIEVPSIQVKDCGEWHNSEAFKKVLTRKREYWNHKFKERLPGRLRMPLANRTMAGGSRAPGHVQFTIGVQQAYALRQIAADHDVSFHVLITAVYYFFLARLSGVEEFTIELPAEGRTLKEIELIIGAFENSIVLKGDLANGQTFKDFLAVMKQDVHDAFDHQEYPYGDLVKNNSDIAPCTKLIYETRPDCYSVGDLTMVGPYFTNAILLVDLLCRVVDHGETLQISFEFLASLFSRRDIERYVFYFNNVVTAIISDVEVKTSDVEILSADEKNLLLRELNRVNLAGYRELTVNSLFERQVLNRPEHVALVFDDRALTFFELNRRSDQVAHYLRSVYSVKRNTVVALVGERSEKTIAGMLGIIKSGAAYLPVESGLSSMNIETMLQRAGNPLVLITDDALKSIKYPGEILSIDRIETTGDTSVSNVNTPGDLCYVTYTDEPTWHAKGVMMSHTNVVSLIAGVNEQVPVNERDCLLATENISSQGSPFEILWSLCNGVEVVIHPPRYSFSSLNRYVSAGDLSMDVSLFFFANYNIEAANKYKLLIDAVKYADQEGFKAVWTPERHFHEFGGLFPNPSVISSALAMVTNQIALRSGSIVSPLHDPIRISEEWAVVDNLSNGRVSLSFAPGWNINDFSLQCDNYEERHKIMIEQIEIVKRLWRGESVMRKNGVRADVQLRTFPTPIQRELSVWLTAAGNENTFILAGEKGTNILTHLLGQDLNELSRKIKLYRDAWRRAGHDKDGKVAVMLHTYVGDELHEVERTVEKPFMEYLESAIGLSKILYTEAGLKAEDIPEEDKEIMLRHSFKRYYKTAALIGTVSSCQTMIKKLKGIGVDEIACLVDFGIEPRKVMEGLKNLKALKDLFVDQTRRKHKPVTIMHVTGPRSEQLVEKSGSKQFMDSLRLLLVTGKAPNPWAYEAMRNSKAQVLNLFGFDEAAICSGISDLKKWPATASHFRPVANAAFYILNKNQQLVPHGQEGDLYMGGTAISMRYWGESHVTGKGIVSNPFQPASEMHNTGRLARWTTDGDILLIDSADTTGNLIDSRESVEKHSNPSIEIDEKIISLWSRILALDETTINIRHNFFDLGADSLKALRLAKAVQQEFSVSVGIDFVYKYPSVQELSKAITSIGVENFVLIPKAINKEYYDVSFEQELLYNKEGAGREYIALRNFGIYKFKCELDIDRLKQAVQNLVDRHACLRTSFVLSGGKVFQRVADQVQVDLKNLNSQYQTLDDAIQGFVAPFDFSGYSLLRCGVFRYPDGKELLLINAHPIICDSVSLGILLSDLCVMYVANVLEPLDLRYVDFASWQRNLKKVQQSLAF